MTPDDPNLRLCGYLWAGLLIATNLAGLIAVVALIARDWQ